MATDILDSIYDISVRLELASRKCTHTQLAVECFNAHVALEKLILIVNMYQGYREDLNQNAY